MNVKEIISELIKDITTIKKINEVTSEQALVWAKRVEG